MITNRPSERQTQDRVVRLFRDKLGYEYLGNWEYREDNANIEPELVEKFLTSQGYQPEIIRKAIKELKMVAGKAYPNLYDSNKAFYNLLRYGKNIKLSPSEHGTPVRFVDWEHPENNHFAIAEEVTIKGKHTKRPDIVLYLNGIAIGVLELKKSAVSVSEGIRQNLDNQKETFIRDFFTTVQLVMAGNDSQGLRYGTIETPERYYLEWKEENPAYNHNAPAGAERNLPRETCEVSDNILDCDIYRLLNKTRLLDFLHNFILFDRGTKKVARHNQYFAVKDAQQHIRRREGGIIWHTQGSGKSLTMVWLAKWILENVTDSRVLIITDREELDEQMEKVFLGAGERNNYYRTESGEDLINQLNIKEKRIIGSLVHKFGRVGKKRHDHYDDFIHEMERALPENFEAKGDIFVFVDECHRTQSGKLHEAMKKILPRALFIGFTGTPLLKTDKPTTMKRFGSYIHTYKFDEGVRDGIILDLRYEARDVGMHITSEEKIDRWFKVKTRGLSDVAKAQLKQRWGKLKKLYSSQDRINKIVSDIILDFEIKPRLATGRGNAMLVAGSIFEACRYYEAFKKQRWNKMAIVTSYKPNVSNIRGEETGEEGEAENIKKFEIYREMIADYYQIDKEEAVKDHWIEKFEKDVKRKFVEEPGKMKLLIVVDKLLTGFDAPSATYLFIDKKMRDHGLFQAVCRVNRLDNKDKGDDLDKEYGYIVDYQDLFNAVTEAIKDYTSGAFEGYDKEDVEGLLKDRLDDAKKKLDERLEKVEMIVEDVPPPKGIQEYKDYFIGDNSEDKQRLRVTFYKAVSALVRAYTQIANEMTEAGYTPAEQREIKQKVKHFTELRDELKLMSGDYVDLKLYDPAMRFLIDNYIQAEESKKLAEFEDRSLLEIIALEGLKAAIQKLPEAIGKDKDALAETIENNIRKLIVEKQDVNPAYYEKMSRILNDLIEQRRQERIRYKEYLKSVEELTRKLLGTKEDTSSYPPSIRNSMAKRALYDNLPEHFDREELANRLHDAIIATKQDDWRNNKIKRRYIKNAIKKEIQEAKMAYIYDLPDNIEVKRKELVDAIFEIALKQEEY